MSAGIQSAVSFAKESTWGTAVTPNKSITVRPTGGIDIKNNIQMVPGIRGSLQRYYDAFKGKVAYEGSYTFDAFADYVGYFLLSAMGTDTPTLHSGESTVYDHVFTETLPKPSLTVEESIAENVRRYAGTIASQLKFSVKSGERLQVEANVMAKSQTASSAITPTFTTVPAFDHTQTQIKIGGSSIGEVESFELTYKNGIDFINTLGSADPSYASVQGGSEVSGKLELYLDSTTITELTNYINKTTRSIELIATGSSIGTAANYVLDLLVPKAVYKTVDTKITDNHNLLSIEFDSYLDTATSKLIAITLTNLLSSY